MYKIKNFIQGLKNFWYYKSVIWNDRWYDYTFMLSIWERKFENMTDNWKNSHYVDSEGDEAEIKRALSLLKLLIEDEFCKDEQDELDHKYGKLEIVENTIKRAKETPENEDALRAELNLIYTKGEARKKKIQNEFFEILKGYERWWD